MSITREFRGFQVSDEFVLTLNSRNGAIEVNLQELMASRLYHSTDEQVIDWYDSSGLKDTDICKVHNISYNHIRDCREHADWNKAKDAFSDANISLTDRDLKLIAGKQARGANGNGTANSGIKFTATHAKNLGMAVFNNLPTHLRAYVSGYDANNSTYQERTKLKVVSDAGIQAFAGAMGSKVWNWEYDANAKQRHDAELKAKQELAEKETKALAFLKTMGFEKPTQEQINSCIAMMA